MGIVLDEFLDFDMTVNTLSRSGGKALGSIYSKFKLNNGFGFNTYTKLFVVPILDYCSGVYGDTISSRKLILFKIGQLDSFWRSIDLHVTKPLRLTWDGYQVELDVTLICYGYGIDLYAWTTLG